MIIDAHLHLSNGEPGRNYCPPRQNQLIAMRWAYGKPPFKDPKALEYRLEQRWSDPDGHYTIESMDDQGVDSAILLPVDYDLAFGQECGITIEEKHSHYAQMQEKYPGRFYPFAGPDPRRTGALEIFKRGINEYKLKGYKIVPGMGYYPWDERLFPMYEICEDLGPPVASCAEAGGGGYRYSRMSEPIHVSDMMAEFPDLKVILLHGGFPYMHWFEESLYVCQGLNAYLQLDVWVHGPAYYGRGNIPKHLPNIFTNEEAVVKMLAKAKDVVGAHKILFGTDSFHGPSFYKEHSVFHAGWKNIINWYKRLPETAAKYGEKFTPEEVDMMLGGNTARLLGIKKDPAYEVSHKFGWRYRYPSPNRAR